MPDGIIPGGFNSSSIPIDDIKTIIKEKCIKVSGSDAAFEEATVNINLNLFLFSKPKLI